MKNFFFLCCIIVFKSCIIDKTNDKRDIVFENSSKETVYCLPSQTDSFKHPYSSYYIPGWDSIFKVPVDSFIFIPDKPADWEQFLNSCENGKMRLFIVEKDSVDKFGWQKVLSENIYTKVYKVDINDLNKCKWRIKYK